jgi:YD repeat-containing protein
VQLGDGTTTLGYIENGQITIEVMNNDGSFRTEIFSKK